MANVAPDPAAVAAPPVVAAPSTGVVTALIASAPDGDWSRKLSIAAVRALRTLIQGVAAALLSGAAGSAVLSTSYWEAFVFSCLAALITAGASFLQNVATFLPEDPMQPAPAPAGG